MQVTKEEGAVPVKNWAVNIDPAALDQAKNLARLPFIDRHGVALMPDAHSGKGSTIGSVIATSGAIIPAAVGVDLGCGMNAIRLSLKASDLPDNLAMIRSAIEKAIPVGNASHQTNNHLRMSGGLAGRMPGAAWFQTLVGIGATDRLVNKANSQAGTLGSGNHFIELCIDENQDVWIMLHSGSRGIGNMIGSHYISEAKDLMNKYFIKVPDSDLSYIPEGTELFDDYMEGVQWAQDYAFENRAVMMEATVAVLRAQLAVPFTITEEAINCHHNYVARENHFGQNLWVTRKGAISARQDQLGIIPGSMGQRSFIVSGKGNADSYCSCSHGAGRAMSRTAARNRFSISDLIAQTEGVECRKDDAVLDELPGAYRNLDEVMAAQADLVSVVHTLKQVLCVKGA